MTFGTGVGSASCLLLCCVVAILYSLQYFTLKQSIFPCTELEIHLLNNSVLARMAQTAKLTQKYQKLKIAIVTS